MEQPRKRTLGLSSFYTKELIRDHKSKKVFNHLQMSEQSTSTFRRETYLSLELRGPEPSHFLLTRRSLMVQFSSLVDERFSQKSSLRLVACLPCLDKHAKQTPLEFQGSKSPRCSILFLPDLPFSRLYWFPCQCLSCLSARLV